MVANLEHRDAAVQAPVRPVKLFIIHASEDHSFLLELEQHLAMLQRRGFLEIWHQLRVTAGDAWQTVAQRNLDDSEIILVLVSAALLASAHPYEQMTTALLRRQTAQVRMIPVLLRPCDWQLSPLWGFQAVPSNGVPVTSVQDRHAAWDEVTQAVWTAVSELRGLSAHRHETPIGINTCLPETKGTSPKRPLLLIISFALTALIIVTLKFFIIPPHEPDILKNPSLERFQVELKCPRGSSCRREIRRLEDPVNRELTILVEVRDVETGQVLTRMQLSQKQLIAWQTSPSMPPEVREFLRTLKIVPIESYIIVAKPEDFPLSSLPAAVVKAAEPVPLRIVSDGTVTKVIAENTDVQPDTVLVELEAQAKFAKELTDLHERLAFYQKKIDSPKIKGKPDQLRDAQQKLAEKQQRLEQIEALLKKSQLMAPRAGKVSKVLVKVGQAVTTGTEVVALTDKALVAELKLPAIAAGPMKVGEDAQFASFAGPLTARVASLRTQGDYALIQYSLPENAEATPGDELKFQVVRLPASALLEGSKVYVSRDGKAAVVPVTIAGRDSDAVFVQGLHGGERVIISHLNEIHEGEAVLIHPATP